MKKIFLIAMLLITVQSFDALAQHSGNANYGENVYQNNQMRAVQTTGGNSDEMTIMIKGIYNQKATWQIATFSILQLGKTAKEATELMNGRMENTVRELKDAGGEITVSIDMVSFVPTYGYVAEKRIFNPKTYNETPSGFELRKNLIIRYRNSSELDKIVAICSNYEIYDLVKVNYITMDQDLIRSQMQKKAMELLKLSVGNYSLMMNMDLEKKEKILQEGFNISYPMENYRNYQAYAKASINPGEKDEVNEVEKKTTQYYNAMVPKEHQFMFNADIVEPSIQLLYELTVKIKLKEDQLPKNTITKNNKYYIITTTGELKPIIL